MSNGLSSFQQTYITIDVYLDPAKLDPSGTGDRAAIAKVSTFGYAPLIEKDWATQSRRKVLRPKV
jgi:phosphate transport system permease protein